MAGRIPMAVTRIFEPFTGLTMAFEERRIEVDHFVTLR